MASTSLLAASLAPNRHPLKHQICLQGGRPAIDQFGARKREGIDNQLVKDVSIDCHKHGNTFVRLQLICKICGRNSRINLDIMLMTPFPNVFFIIRKFTTTFERVATVVGDFLGMDWTALFQLVDVRRQIFEALPPTPLLPLLQLLHLFTREAKTASVSLATSLVAGEHLNAKSCARKPGIAVLSEAITAYTSDIIRYQINLSAFSANSKSQSIPRWISNQGHRPISWEVSATSGWGSSLQPSQHI